MLLPASIHGPYKACKTAAAKAVEQVIRGCDFNAAFEEQGWADTALSSGLFVLHGPSPLLGGDAHFHVWLPLSEVLRAVSARKLTVAAMEPVFEQALSTRWGLLSLLAISNSIWTHPEHRQTPFLRSLMPCWDEFVNQGTRFTAGSNTADDLWSHADTVKGILVRRGIRLGELDVRPTASRLAELTGIQPSRPAA
jgi:hypothetical protein